MVLKRKKSNSGTEATPEKTESSTSSGVQLSIKEFYRSSKLRNSSKPEEDSEKGSGSSNDKRRDPSPRFSKSARRRLLFD